MAPYSDAQLKEIKANIKKMAANKPHLVRERVGYYLDLATDAHERNDDATCYEWIQHAKEQAHHRHG